MSFWDSSALIPLILDESTSERLRARHELEPMLIVWWGSEVECASAIARCERDGKLDHASAAWASLDRISEAWVEIPPAPDVRRGAVRVTRTHHLRAGHALQLAAALTASEGMPETLPFVTLDERLADAARREGFPVLHPA